jgi:hypothetical protein
MQEAFPAVMSALISSCVLLFCEQEFFQVDDYSGGGQDSEHGITSISWNESPFEPAKMAVGTYSKIASVWTCDVGSKWREECILGKTNSIRVLSHVVASYLFRYLHSSGEHNGVVHDIAWAPVMGRSYHLIATASRENCFRVRQRYSRRLRHEYILIALLCHRSFYQIHKLRRKEDGSLEYDKTQTVHTKDGSAVWRVSWNTTGMLPLFSYFNSFRQD